MQVFYVREEHGRRRVTGATATSVEHLALSSAPVIAVKENGRVLCEEPGCPICQQHANTPVVTKNGFHYVRCQRCRAVYVHPLPPPETLQAHYQNPAYFAGDEQQGYRSYADMHKALAPHFQRRLATLAPLMERQGRLLDFGCADGYFLEKARAAGWDIAGVEIAAAMAASAVRRLSIPIASALRDLSADRFDAITLWEVVEHLPQPVSELRTLYSRLRPGGVLALSTPNADHWQALREPAAWPAYRPPSHLVLFGASSMDEALTRAGFELAYWRPNYYYDGSRVG